VEFAALAPAHPARPATSNIVVIMRNEYAFMVCITPGLSHSYLERCAGTDLRDFQLKTARVCFSGLAGIDTGPQTRVSDAQVSHSVELPGIFLGYAATVRMNRKCLPLICTDATDQERQVLPRMDADRRGFGKKRPPMRREVTGL
jgi:hypothetical protein